MHLGLTVLRSLGPRAQEQLSIRIAFKQVREQVNQRYGPEESDGPRERLAIALNTPPELVFSTDWTFRVPAWRSPCVEGLRVHPRARRVTTCKKRYPRAQESLRCHADDSAWVCRQPTRWYGRALRQLSNKVRVERLAESKNARKYCFRNGLLAGTDDIKQRRNLLEAEL